MFKVGDPVVHPVHGAGVVEVLEEREIAGKSDKFYRIKLLTQPASNLIVSTKAADTLGLRRAIARSRLSKVWRILKGNAEKLPSDHKKRYEKLQAKLQGGDVLQIAEAVRDMNWRQLQEGSLTTRGKRILEDGMSLLVGEIAATQGIEMVDAEVQVRSRLEKGQATQSAN